MVLYDSEVAKFIARKGEGFFLMSLKVPDTQEALEELKEKPVDLIDEKPRKFRDSGFGFIHPRSFFGVLLEVID